MAGTAKPYIVIRPSGSGVPTFVRPDEVAEIVLAENSLRAELWLRNGERILWANPKTDIPDVARALFPDESARMATIAARAEGRWFALAAITYVIADVTNIVIGLVHDTPVRILRSEEVYRAIVIAACGPAAERDLTVHAPKPAELAASPRVRVLTSAAESHERAAAEQQRRADLIAALNEPKKVDPASPNYVLDVRNLIDSIDEIVAKLVIQRVAPGGAFANRQAADEAIGLKAHLSSLSKAQSDPEALWREGLALTAFVSTVSDRNEYSTRARARIKALCAALPEPAPLTDQKDQRARSASRSAAQSAQAG